VATFNAGLAEVRGDFSVRLDADDLLVPGSLARALALFERFPTVGLVYGHPQHFLGPMPAPRVGPVRSWTVWPGTDWLELRCRRGVNCITSPEVVMRQTVVARVGGQRELAQTHDMEMWMRLAAASDVGHIEGPDQALHREHEASRSEKMVDPYVDFVERRAAFEALLEFDGLANRDRLQRLARRALAVDALRRACQAFDRGRSDREPIADLVVFARETYPRYTALRQWWGLRLRQRLGPVWVHRLPPFLACAALRRLTNDVRYRRWSRTGV
jgi:hypothetical protein